MKKLSMIVLMACVFWIAGCERVGDVFLSEPPPPALHPIEGIRTIRVNVQNRYPAGNLVPSEVAARIMKRLQANAKGVELLSEADEREADAVLAVSILEEKRKQTKMNLQKDVATWVFTVKFSSALTRRDGKTIWNKPLQSVSQEMTWDGFQEHHVIPELDPNVQEDLRALIGENLVDALARIR